MFLPYQSGELQGVGRGRDAHLAASYWSFEQRWFPQVRVYLEALLQTYPDDPTLLLAYVGALSTTGDRAGAKHQLERLAQRAPPDSAAVTARRILAEWRERLSTLRMSRRRPSVSSCQEMYFGTSTAVSL